MQKQENQKTNRGAKNRAWLRRPLFFCGSAVYLELALHFFRCTSLCSAQRIFTSSIPSSSAC